MPSKKKCKKGSKRMKGFSKGGYAKTPQDYTMGILNGKNMFKFSDGGPHNMTMTPMGYQIPFPLYYQGLKGGNIIDQGIAYPGQNFQVRGNEVREYPMMQNGSYMGPNGVYGTNYPYQVPGIAAPPLEDPSFGYIPPYPTGEAPVVLDPTQMTTDNQVSLRGSQPLYWKQPQAPLHPDGYFSEANVQAGDGKSQGLKLFGKKDSDTDSNKNVFGKYPIYPFLSTAWNLGMGLLHKEKQRPIQNLQSQKALSKLRDLKYTPNYRPLQLAQNKMESDIRNSVGSVSGMMANLMNATANIQNQMGDMDRQAANINNLQIMPEYIKALDKTGFDRAAERRRIDDANRQHRAASRAHIAEALRQSDQYAMQEAYRQQEYNQALKQTDFDNKFRIAQLKARFPTANFEVLKSEFPEYF